MKSIVSFNSMCFSLNSLISRMVATLREFPIQLVDYCLTFLCDFSVFLKTQFRLKEGEEKLNDGLTELDA